ncbi:effector-associated domain EAD1-containing protein [Verrucosispora sp. WMMD573]|uniref:GAP1-N1 domain-containing protein n=1 Tax=Verrucosispora sp. WMMD573 TaxID=3015149 RepID=UPI00248D2F97|nr:effector-associated domain EAD1-containing protein [Verrucosispora sp. WMMD573]WBB56032.1 effector-associated domain EAD1-containing protein [Verrucosispora sp. WMMD573]
MIVEQAIFGEVKGGHAVKAASGDPMLAAELAPRLDLPDTVPPGVDWSPFVSGFAHRHHFVVARTFMDVRAARAGMVLSHALIVPIEDVVHAPDLRPLFDRLIVEANAPSDLPALNLDLGHEVPPPSADLPAAAAALSTREAGPVVRLGNHGFDELVISLWGRLLPAMRRRFAFRLSFGPGDLVETPQPALVCTPPSLIGRWRGQRLIEAQYPKVPTLAAAMLSGSSEGEALRSFTDRIGAELTSFSDLSLLEEAYRLTVLKPDTIANTVAAVRLVGRLSPTTAHGADDKASLMGRLTSHLGNATADDVLPLRNLALRGFDQAERVWAELENWAARNSFPAAQDPAFMLVIADAMEASESTEDWRTAVLGGLSRSARAQGAAFVTAFWRWAEADPAIVKLLWKVVEADTGLEDRLVSVAPQRLKCDAARPILEHARQEHLYRLHGATASAAYDPAEAVRLQVAVEPPPAAADGVRLALSKATPREVLVCAAKVVDPRVIQLAAEQVAQTPTLLADEDLSREAARLVWSTALDLNMDAWRGPADPRSAFDAVLVDVLDSRPAPPQLVERLSRTPLADLTGFARRPELWSTLTGTTRDALIRATARGWLDNAAANRATPGLEPEIQAAILSDHKLDALLDQFADGRVGAAIQIMLALPAFDEHRFCAWLRLVANHSRPIPPTDAEAIGRLTQERRWRHATDELLRMLRNRREDIRPALRACVSMLGPLDRWWHKLSPISPAEKWESLETLAAELFETGPDHDNLWARAGGHNADLQQFGNGRARWRDALSRIRRGGKGPRVDKLLREMLTEFPSNASLRFMADDKEFGGRL